ncbi:anti-sigma factor family protein, partial [Kaarinaea lacus]
MIVVTDKLSTESFHAFIDEQLNDEQYLQVEAQLDEIPEKVEEIQQCQIINERLREVFDPIVEEQIPEDLYELALYGIISEYQDDADDYQQYGYEFDEATNAITGFNEEVATPLDSFDAALELQDENFIDDDEFAELEQLSAKGELNLADFDIDNIRDDAGNILPDIFSEEGKFAYTASQPEKSAEELSMLDEIGSLSLEPLEETNEQSSVETSLDSTEQTIAPEVTEPEIFSEDNIEKVASEL